MTFVSTLFLGVRPQHQKGGHTLPYIVIPCKPGNLVFSCYPHHDIVSSHQDMHISFVLPNQKGKQPLWLHMLMMAICSPLEKTFLLVLISH
jgi:hypothetical protein